MKRIIAVALLATGLCGAAWAQSTPSAVAQQQQKEIARGEPARWMKGDNSMQAQLATKRKEIGAALNEALNECRKVPTSERYSCVRQARKTYKEDMANVKELVAQSNRMGGVYDTAGPSE
ncbi:hypothetical protein [Massilia sp. METH4]|uniref:hypothetical protein n=1 Tax=Massilia sp. METH4 TaxID=3123041 RepID=UPI0030CFA6F3